MENNFYVYAHVAKQTGQVFYIGKGRDRRAYTRQHRTRYWRNIVNKYGLEVRIVADNLNEKKAFSLEHKLIKKIGRRDLGTGGLINLTDGGEGTANPSAETRALIGLASKGNKYSLGRVLPEHERVQRSLSNLGQKRTLETKKKLAKAKVGSKNPNYCDKAHKFVHENGHIVYCTQNELKNIMRLDGVPITNRRGVSELVKGLRRQVAGWFLNSVREKITNYDNNAPKGAAHPNHNPQVNKYAHEEHGEFVGTQYDFRTKFGLVQSQVSQITSRKRGSHKGWRCVAVDVK